jgi:SulP family sulfate permease
VRSVFAERPIAGDLVAGLSVAVVLIPQSLAYAEIAGLPPYVGLYAAALPPIAAAFLASSRYLQTGPVAMTALLTFGALTPLAVAGSPEFIKLASLLALLVGIARIGIGLLRVGFIAYFMSQPVLVGFTSAAAILIVGSQLPTAFGVDASGGKIVSRAWWTVVHPGEWQLEAVALTAVVVLVIIGGRRLHRLFPGVLVAVLVGLGWGVLASYDGETVGSVPGGLPTLGLSLPWGSFIDLVIPAVVIALVGFAEAAAISRAFAAEERERWDPSREFISQGAANLAAAVSGAFPVGGSFSRSSVARMSGGRTRWTGAVAGIAVLAFIPVAGILDDLPVAVLAGIVVAAVARLVRLGDIVRIARYSVPQGLVAVATFSLTLVLAPRIDLGVLLGIGLGVAVHLLRELRFSVNSDLRDGVLHLQPVGVLYFGSTPALQEALLNELADHPDITKLVIGLGRLGRIDYTGALALRRVVLEAERAGLEVAIAGVPEHAERPITRIWESAISEPEDTL